MPWSQTSPMDQRTQFIADDLRDRLSVTELCDAHGVSRKTGYTWIDRYLTHGPQGLEERSRRPAPSPRQTPDHVVAAILEARRRHPSWGAKKLVSILAQRHPRWPWPARSTVCDILSRHGLVPKQRKRRAIGHPAQPTSPMAAPNEVLERRLHRAVQDRRRPLLLSADPHRWLQPLPARVPSAVLHPRAGSQACLHARVQGIRPAAAHPHRQRRAVRHQHPRAAVPAVRVVGTPGHLAGAASNRANRSRTAVTSACIAR